MTDRDDVPNDGVGSEDVFVELLGAIIDRLDRQEEKLDQVLEAVAVLREELERQAEVQEAFDDRITVAIESGTVEAYRLADYQFRMHNVAREVYGQQAANHYSGMAVIELLKILTPRIDEETVTLALQRTFRKGGSWAKAWVQTMVEFEEASKEQRKAMPSVRASLERDWKLNRDGLREARLAERERPAREEKGCEREENENRGRER